MPLQTHLPHAFGDQLQRRAHFIKFLHDGELSRPAIDGSYMLSVTRLEPLAQDTRNLSRRPPDLSRRG